MLPKKNIIQKHVITSLFVGLCFSSPFSFSKRQLMSMGATNNAQALAQDASKPVPIYTRCLSKTKGFDSGELPQTFRLLCAFSSLDV